MLRSHLRKQTFTQLAFPKNQLSPYFDFGTPLPFTFS